MSTPTDPPNDEQAESDARAGILRHAARDRPWTPPTQVGEFMEEIESHLTKHVGPVETVFHEIVSDLVHLDVHFIPATDERPVHVLFTTGVSDRPMTVPAGAEEYARAELLIQLPRHWPLTSPDFDDEKNYWPIRWLKTIGRLPHEYDTWIGWGHTIPNGDPPEPIADTKFVGFLLMPPMGLSPEVFRLQTRAGPFVHVYQLVPLYPEEMDLKLQKGSDEIERRFEKEKLSLIVDANRKNVAKRRGWFLGG